MTITKYTKHYYIGSERVASALGSIKSLGMLCEGLVYADAALIAEMNDKVEDAAEVMHIIYDTFEKDMLLPTPFFYNEVFSRCDRTHYQDMYHPYWYHPDHLGSSSYITNLDGEINQHLEYLPFGEALVEEHLSSYNSPFKFNAKEFDAETGNYYYSSRYYNPKWSLFLSVDEHYFNYPSISPYAYTAHNPVKYVDPDGRDFRVRTVNDDEGVQHHTIETTIHIYGDKPGKSFGEAIGSLNNNTEIMEDGSTLTFDISVQYHDSKESAVKAVEGNAGDNLLEVSPNVSVDEFNFYDLSGSGEITGGKAIIGGREGKAKTWSSAIHEIGHFFGLDERYELIGGEIPFTPEKFRGDVLGQGIYLGRSDYETRFEQVHYQNLYNHISNDGNSYSKQGDVRVYNNIGRIRESDRNR